MLVQIIFDYPLLRMRMVVLFFSFSREILLLVDDSNISVFILIDQSDESKLNWIRFDDYGKLFSL